MGQHPSTTIEFSFPKSYTKSQIHQAIKRAIDANEYFEFETLEPEKFMTAIYSTPKCHWLDMVHFSLRENSKHIIVTGYSRSTNICPGSCGIFRPLFTCVGGYNDHGQNCQHILDVMDHLETENGDAIDYTKKLLSAQTGRTKKLSGVGFDEGFSSDEEDDERSYYD